jgi:hypothetical protein
MTHTQPAPARRERPSARSVLIVAGVGDQTVTAAAHLEDESRSHTVTRARLPDGSSYVIKQLPGSAQAAGRSLMAELYTYRLASWRADLAALLPTCVHLDERRQLVVLQAAPPEHLYTARIADPGFPQPEFGAALGRSLARFHTATAGLPAVSVANCGVIALPDAPVDERRLGDDSVAGKQAIAMMCADDDVCEVLRATAALFKPSCLIHGDVKWDNVILDDGPPPRVLLFDWELSGQGDPAWDLGSALADTVALPTRSAPRSGVVAEWLRETERALLTAYGAAAPTPGADFAERVAGCWCARLAHLALECAAAIGDAAHPRVASLLESAKHIARQSDSLEREMRTLLDSPR